MRVLASLLLVPWLYACSSGMNAPSCGLCADLTRPVGDSAPADLVDLGDAAARDMAASDLGTRRLWVQEDLPILSGIDLYGVHGTGPSDIFVVGDQGTILHSDGKAWARQDSKTGQRLLRVFALSPTNIYATGDHVIVHSIDGRGWSVVYQNSASPQLNGVIARRADDVYVVGDQGTILHASDGQTFTPLVSGTTTSLHVPIRGSTGDVLISGDQDLLRGAMGAPWVTVSVGRSEACMSLWESPSGALFIAGDRGVILASTDERSFQLQPSATTARLMDVWGLSSTNVYMVGRSGTILHSLDGQRWAAEASGTTQQLNGIWGADPDNVYVVGLQGTLLRLR